MHRDHWARSNTTEVIMTAPCCPEPLPDVYLLRKYVEIGEQYPDIDDDVAEYEEILDLITGELPQSFGLTF